MPLPGEKTGIGEAQAVPSTEGLPLLMEPILRDMVPTTGTSILMPLVSLLWPMKYARQIGV